MKTPYFCDTNLIPWDNCPAEMTNETAFEIGKGDYPSFYDLPIWTPNVKTFKYVRFFEWSCPTQGGGRYEDGEYYCHWTFYGSLREDCFKNLEQKRHYIKGILASYAGNCIDGSISGNFANSFKTRDRVVRWLNEILANKYGQNKNYSIVTNDKIETIPAVATFTLTASNEIIDFIKS